MKCYYNALLKTEDTQTRPNIIPACSPFGKIRQSFAKRPYASDIIQRVDGIGIFIFDIEIWLLKIAKSAFTKNDASH